ncbi:ABC transporter permease [Methylococcus capsulatus]|uniref:ABC transporter permease n=1 Tax=Methylococcus capsulatus TaxID=414 RepID=UPI001C52E35F|nr:ABC transporter permease [Methylococcus capsulatus]QXP88564.1 ABC transporter permease [Methylococcus capsulatus]QXP94422.1 ABC transporter permease [Methylococcus capsulatus]UQN13616.1 ABC transporter permease [Methylococcus capsulatus]
MSSHPEIIIEAGKSEHHYWRDVWRYRELFYFLAWRDILVRYKQTAIGLAWALVRPLFTIIVFTLIFGRLARLPSEGAPYSALVLVGMIPWQFFASAVNEASLGLANKENIITKVYFPRIIIPISGVIVNLVELAVGLAMLAVLLAWQQVAVTLNMLFLPLILLPALLLTFGCAVWVSALSVRFRDFRQVVPFALQMGLYISPIAYSAAIIPERWRVWYALNPFTGIIEGLRWSVFASSPTPPLQELAISLGLATLATASGIAYFRSIEKRFAELL